MALLHMDMQHILIQKSWWSVIITKKKYYVGSKSSNASNFMFLVPWKAFLQ